MSDAKKLYEKFEEERKQLVESLAPAMEMVAISYIKEKTYGDDPFYTVEEAAQYTKLSKKTLYNSKDQGKLRGYNVGGSSRGKLVFRKSDLDKYILGKV